MAVKVSKQANKEKWLFFDGILFYINLLSFLSCYLPKVFKFLYKFLQNHFLLHKFIATHCEKSDQHFILRNRYNLDFSTHHPPNLTLKISISKAKLFFSIYSFPIMSLWSYCRINIIIVFKCSVFSIEHRLSLHLKLLDHSRHTM